MVNELLSVLCGRKQNTQRSGYTNAGRKQCVPWVSQGYRPTDFHKFSKVHPKRSAQLAPQYENGERITKSEDRVIILVETDAQELVMN